jgi:hypothetical protein
MSNLPHRHSGAGRNPVQICVGRTRFGFECFAQRIKLDSGFRWNDGGVRSQFRKNGSLQ